MAAGVLLSLITCFRAKRNGSPRNGKQLLPIGHSQLLLTILALPFALMAALAAGTSAVAHHATAAFTAWAAAIVLTVLGSVRAGERFWPQLSRRDGLESGGLFIASFLLRGLWLEDFPNTLSGDEGSVGLAARDFRNGLIDNPFSFGWFSFPSLYFAIQSVGVWLLGDSASALRIPSAFAGALTVVAVYWMARTLFDRTTGLIAAGILLASHYHIHISRIGLNNVWDGLFAATAIGFLWDGWVRNRRSSFVFSGIAVGLGQYFYISIRALPVLILLWLGMAWIGDRTRFRQRLPGLLSGAWAAGIAFLPLGVLFAQRPDDFLAPLRRVGVLDGWLEREAAIRGVSGASIILEQALKTALGFTHEPLRLLYDPGAPLLLAGAATLFLLGLLWALVNINLRYTLILLPLLATIVGGGLSTSPPASQRFIMAAPFVAVLTALPLVGLRNGLNRWRPRKRVGSAATAAVLAIVMAVDVHYCFFDVYGHYVLGGWNTQTATEIAHYLRDQPTRDLEVYSFAAPRMSYHSHSTIPFLAPGMRPTEIIDPLTETPPWSVKGPTVFIFLPEREGELRFVQEAVPNGVIHRHLLPNGLHTFTSYRVEGSL